VLLVITGGGDSSGVCINHAGTDEDEDEDEDEDDEVAEPDE
jgi:hypothetical protein